MQHGNDQDGCALPAARSAPTEKRWQNRPQPDISLLPWLGWGFSVPARPQRFSVGEPGLFHPSTAPLMGFIITLGQKAHPRGSVKPSRPSCPCLYSSLASLSLLLTHLLLFLSLRSCSALPPSLSCAPSTSVAFCHSFDPCGAPFRGHLQKIARFSSSS